MNYDKLPYLMTRQEVADLIGVCQHTVSRKESQWGLNMARLKWSSSRVRYRKDILFRQLREIGMLP